jgi:hypothetical protein
MTVASEPAAVAPPNSAGLLTPFWIDEGVRVLAVGAGPDGLVQELARRGADVTVIESDASAARKLGSRSVGLTRVSIVQSTLSRMRSSTGVRRRSFDLLVHVPSAAERGGAPGGPPVEDVVAAAAELLRASGTLILAAANPWGLRVLLDGVRPGAGPGPLGLRAALDAYGLREQRWLIAYPDPFAPEVIVDARLLGSEEGADIATTFVRTPVGERPGTTRLADPLPAFRSAAEAGLAASVADWFIVAAMRDGASDASIVREGLLFIAPDPQRQPAWADARELERIGGRWLIHPSDSYAPIASGPFILEPRTVAVPAGVSGEDVVVEALSHGLHAQEARDALDAWWAAARAAIASGDADRRPLDVLPRDFVVRPDGTWSFVAGDLALRFPMPLETVALRAIGWTLATAVLERGWVPGLAPSLTVADGARAILDVIGVRCLAEHAYMWQELEVDLMLLTGPLGLSRPSGRERIRALTDMPLGSRLAALPAATLIAAGLAAPGLAAEAGALRARLAAATAELEVASSLDGERNGPTDG